MRNIKGKPLTLLALLLICAVLPPAGHAEAGVLVVSIIDASAHPVANIQIGVEGDGGTAITGDDGRARIPLARDTRANTWVKLQILTSPPGKDYTMVSPWDRQVLVPSFENESQNFVEVVVVQRGDRAALENGTTLKSFAEKII